MRSFEVSDVGPSEFIGRIESELAAREFDRYVSVSLDGDQLRIGLRWMGSTRFDYLVTPNGDGFKAELVQQQVAPLHSAFRAKFEGYFEEALTEVGAKVD